MRTGFTAYDGFLAFIILFTLSVAGAPVFGDPDTAWHLTAGDWIRLHGTVSTVDPWSFTAHDESWYNLSWLFDIALSALFAIGHFSALYALTLFSFTFCLWFMAHHSIKRGASPLAVFLLTLAAIPPLFIITLARPNLCSLVLTVLFYAVLHRYRTEGRLRTLFWLPPLMALWVNLHGGFIFAFLLIGFFFAEAVWHRDRRKARAYGFILAACMAATVLNPYGLAIYYGAYRTLATGYNVTLIEWKPVAVGHHLPMTLLLVLFMLIGNFTDRRQPLVDRLVGTAALLLALNSIRHSGLAALLLLPLLSLRLTAIMAEGSWAERFARIDAAIARDMIKTDVRILASLMAAGAVLIVLLPYPRDAILAEPLGFPKAHFPVQEAAYIETHYPNLRFFDDYNIGGYLAYLWRGRVKLFIDGRSSSLYSDDLLEDYVSINESAGFGGKPEIAAKRYRLDGLIIANDNPRAGDWYWNTHWHAVYRGPVATIYLRNP